MAIDKEGCFTPSEVEDLMSVLMNFLGDAPNAELGIENLTISEISHFVSTVH